MFKFPKLVYQVRTLRKGLTARFRHRDEFGNVQEMCMPPGVNMLIIRPRPWRPGGTDERRAGTRDRFSTAH